MKTKSVIKELGQGNESPGIKTISPERIREIMQEEGLEYNDGELAQILEFISKVIAIGIGQYERKKQKEVTIISINKKQDEHETKSIPLYPRKYGRAS